ncbi:hypothetical protein [Nonomuraea sp. NPDC049784]|uniref:hypothetical protein n=1 Tax=Nonomuraea sp. NPDC049784 TaxID=3154361 RepID=UPI0033F67012
MMRDEPAGYRRFLDGVARAMADEDDIWQFQLLAGGSTLVARAADDDGAAVALIDAGSLNATVAVDDIARLADLAVQVGATASQGRPAAFVCSRRTPTEDAVKVAYLRNLRILSVHPTGEDSWGYDYALLSHQKITQPPNAPTLSERQWEDVHHDIRYAVFYDAQHIPIASFAGLSALLAWQEENDLAGTGGLRHFDLPAGTLMVIPDQPPIPVVGVTLRFHKETRPLRAAGEEGAFADLVTEWLWG